MILFYFILSALYRANYMPNMNMVGRLAMSGSAVWRHSSTLRVDIDSAGDVMSHARVKRDRGDSVASIVCMSFMLR